jgi:Ca2+-binding RTX toxin-like protein
LQHINRLLPLNIVDNSLRLSLQAGGKTVGLPDGPSGGEMLISRQKLLRLQQALKATKNKTLRIIITNNGNSADNFTYGAAEFQLSGNLKSASSLKRSSTRSLKSLLAAISQKTSSLLGNPVLEPDQLVPVITPPKPDPSPSPSPQPTPSPKPPDGGDGGGGNSRTFLLSVNSANSELTFGGTATGQIRLTGLAGSTSTFTRDGLTQITSVTPLNTYTIILSAASNDLDGSTYTSGIKVAG